jgi:hypothetical protein
MAEKWHLLAFNITKIQIISDTHCGSALNLLVVW